MGLLFCFLFTICLPLLEEMNVSQPFLEITHSFITAAIFWGVGEILACFGKGVKGKGKEKERKGKWKERKEKCQRKQVWNNSWAVPVRETLQSEYQGTFALFRTFRAALTPYP